MKWLERMQLGQSPNLIFVGKTALITGASRGIGSEVAQELARQGAKCVLLVARDHRRLAEVAAKVEAIGATAVPIPLDLTNPVAVNIAIAQAWQAHGPFDLLVNCAGVAYQAPFLEARREQIQAELDVNMMGLFTITQPIARRMAAKRTGKIVNVSSLMGKLAAPNLATYAATKFAIVGFTQALRQELAEHNVEVAALLPSLTETDMTRSFDRMWGVVPHTPREVAEVLVRRLNRRSPEIAVGWQASLLMAVQRVSPQLSEALVRWSARLSRGPTILAPRQLAYNLLGLN
jgi:3-oxoacyl-[acyl-carrier protein] reductase